MRSARTPRAAGGCVAAARAVRVPLVALVALIVAALAAGGAGWRPAAAQNLAPVQYAPAAAEGMQQGLQNGAPSPFKRLGFDQRVGQHVPADLTFRDETGRAVKLGDYFGRRPLVLALVYFRCPMLCPLTLAGLSRSLKGMSFDPGKEYDVLVVSFDPHDTTAAAAAAKRESLARFGRLDTAAGWHFLTGDAEPIRRLTQAVGFRYFYDTQAQQFAHPAGIVVLTPQGAASRYLYGIEFPSRNVRLGLVEAANNRIGSPIDQVLLYCFHYDPVQGKYSAVTLNIVRLSAILCVVGLGLMIVLLRRHEHKDPNPLGTA
jgi:protein SCO1/2